MRHSYDVFIFILSDDKLISSKLLVWNDPTFKGNLCWHYVKDLVENKSFYKDIQPQKDSKSLHVLICLKILKISAS